MPIRRRIPRDMSPSAFFQGEHLNGQYRRKVDSLLGRQRGYSLHCGGVVILGNGQAEGQRAEDNRTQYIESRDWITCADVGKGKFKDHQIKWDKRECQQRR